MKTLYDVISQEAKEAISVQLGCTYPGPGMNIAMREIQAPEEGFTVGDAMTAYLNYMTKQTRVIKIEVRNVYGVATIYPVNEAAKLLSEIAGTKTLTNKTLALAERMGFLIAEATPAKTKYATV